MGSLSSNDFLVSVIVPVFNEQDTIVELLDRVNAVPIEKEIIVVDDYSSDKTRQLLADVPYKNLRIVLHEQNQGKGAALRTGFRHAAGDIVIIQDADLEYDPYDYLVLVQAIIDHKVDVVYGSRFLGQHQFTSLSHYFGNRFLTWLTNLMFGSELTDMETCYKAFRRGVLLSLPLTANRFDIEPEVTGLLLKFGYTILEVPISYRGRTFQEGKKISWHDGIAAIRMLIQCRFSKLTEIDAISYT